MPFNFGTVGSWVVDFFLLGKSLGLALNGRSILTPPAGHGTLFSCSHERDLGVIRILSRRGHQCFSKQPSIGPASARASTERSLIEIY